MLSLKMYKQINFSVLLLSVPLLLLLLPSFIVSRRIMHRRLILHLPVKVKTHHHTHTVFKHIHSHSSHSSHSADHDSHSGGTKQTIYKILGYSTHHGLPSTTLVMHGGGGGGGGHHVHGHSLDAGSGGGHHQQQLGEITYEDMHDCESGRLAPHHDMIFNHYSRHDDDDNDDYPDEEDEFIDVQEGDDWL